MRVFHCMLQLDYISDISETLRNMDVQSIILCHMIFVTQKNHN